LKRKKKHLKTKEQKPIIILLFKTIKVNKSNTKNTRQILRHWNIFNHFSLFLK